MNPQLESQIRGIVQSMIGQAQSKNQYSTIGVPFHTHNGVDSPRVSEKNLALGTKFIDFADIGVGTAVLNGISNFSRLDFYGFATATNQRVIINGVALFGTCYSGIGDSSAGNFPVQSTFIQTSNFLYINTTPAYNVGATDEFFIVAENNTSTIVASAAVMNWDSQSITINVTLASGWTLEGGLVIS